MKILWFPYSLTRAALRVSLRLIYTDTSRDLWCRHNCPQGKVRKWREVYPFIAQSRTSVKSLSFRSVINAVSKVPVERTFSNISRSTLVVIPATISADRSFRTAVHWRSGVLETNLPHRSRMWSTKGECLYVPAMFAVMRRGLLR